MSVTLLNYSPENHTVPRRGVLCINTKLVLTKGINKLTLREFNVLKKMSYFEDFVEDRIFKVVTTLDDDELDEGKKLRNLNKLNVDEALSVIAQETSIDTLTKWAERESAKNKPRVTIVNALNKQIETVKTGDVATGTE